MLIEHEGSIPEIDSSAYVAPNATICGNVSIGRGTRIMFGACIVAEGAPITIGENCIVMESAVIRSTRETGMGSRVNTIMQDVSLPSRKFCLAMKRSKPYVNPFVTPTGRKARRWCRRTCARLRRHWLTFLK